MRRLLGVMLPAVGCGELPVDPATTDEVFTLEACPGEGCVAWADGATPVEVQVHLNESVTQLTDELSVDLKASAGIWLFTDEGASTWTGTFGEDRGLSAFLVPPRDRDEVLLEADLAGYRRVAVLTLAPTPVESLTLSPTPTVLSTEGSTSLILTAQARTPNGGAPTHGTRVQITDVITSPEDIAWTSAPAEVWLDDLGTGTLNVHVGSGAESVAVAVEAILPDGSPGTNAEVQIFAE
ncbi:MAG: hypothetical protein H6739_32955 [Alphaproteobacteria bacterium]|nr:hypothetical protein [Alphaproteobacteria bacterium]